MLHIVWKYCSIHAPNRAACAMLRALFSLHRDAVEVKVHCIVLELDPVRADREFVISLAVRVMVMIVSTIGKCSAKGHQEYAQPNLQPPPGTPAQSHVRDSATQIAPDCMAAQVVADNESHI